MIPVSTPSRRFVAIDVYRGATMLFMASEQLHLEKALETTGGPVASFFADQLSHREWTGCTPWDMIQPSFTFLAGAALAFSLANRRDRGESEQGVFLHILWRSFLLVALGIFLRSMHSTITNFTFEDVLTQIGLGYPFLYLIAKGSRKARVMACGALLFGYWLLFALWPLPPPGFDFATVGVKPDWHKLTGFAAHWDKNTNPAAAFDVWFLNLFPRTKPFRFNGGGYLTLSFIPSLATMILGLLAGEYLRSERTLKEKINHLLICGVVGLAAGTILHYTTICPIVKRIWTPSWTLLSAGWASLILAFFLKVIPPDKTPKWTFPFVVVGMNSIAMYVIVHVGADAFGNSLRTHFHPDTFKVFGETWERPFVGVGIMVIEWLILWWMYRRKIFLKC